jgi:hypothetical protein
MWMSGAKRRMNLLFLSVPENEEGHDTEMMMRIAVGVRETE